MISTWKDMRWAKCPLCNRLWPEGVEAIKAHIHECVEEHREQSAEVADEDQIELGCENLAPRNLGNDEVD